MSEAGCPAAITSRVARTSQVRTCSYAKSEPIGKVNPLRLFERSAFGSANTGILVTQRSTWWSHDLDRRRPGPRHRMRQYLNTVSSALSPGNPADRPGFCPRRAWLAPHSAPLCDSRGRTVKQVPVRSSLRARDRPD